MPQIPFSATPLGPVRKGRLEEPSDALARHRIIELMFASEAELRMSLRLSLEPSESDGLPLRKGRRVAWFEDASRLIRPDVTSHQLRRLNLALAASIGAETLV